MPRQPAVEAVHRRRQLRLLRGGEPAVLPAAGRHHARQPARREDARPHRGRDAAASGSSGVAVGLRTSATLGVFKYYSFFVQDVSDALDAIGLGIAAAAAHGRAADRDQLLHLPGDHLRRRRQAAAGRAGLDHRRRDLPELLPAPGGRADRPRQRVPAPAARRRAIPNRVAVGAGLALIALGLVKKVMIADYLARTIVDPVFGVPQAYAGAGPAGRRLRLRGPDLLRLLRLHRHGDRAGPADGLHLPAELQQPLPGAPASATSGAAGT